jgi:hypothetical protein
MGARTWKFLGIAGLAGVAATGAVVARRRRAHQEYEPDELRERLHARLADVRDAGLTNGNGHGPAPGAAPHPESDPLD